MSGNSPTWASPSRTSQVRGVVRTVPIANPRRRAMTHEARETATVQPRPLISHERYVSSPYLICSKKIPQFQWYFISPPDAGNDGAEGTSPCPVRQGYFLL